MKYQEIDPHVRLTGLDGAVPVLEGASGSYREIAPHVEEQTFDGSEAVNFLIEQAHASSERPLVIVPIGKLTNGSFSTPRRSWTTFSRRLAPPNPPLRPERLERPSRQKRRLDALALLGT